MLCSMADLLFLASCCPVQVSDLELTPDDAAVIASTIRAELARLSDLPEVRTAVFVLHSAYQAQPWLCAPGC